MMLSHHISVETLIVLLKDLCEREATRDALQEDPFTAPHLPLVQAHLQQLISFEPTPPDPRVIEMTAQLAELDGVSDRHAGALLGTMRDAADLVEEDDPALAHHLRAAADVMEGEGLITLTRARYDAIGGHASRRSQLMTPQLRAALSQIRFGNHNLLSAFDRWVQRAEQLSSLEVERVALVGQVDDTPRRGPAELQRLKRDTIYRLNALLVALRDSSIDPLLQHAIRAPLVRASEDARAANA